jgi:hypothetical protein
MTSERTYGRPFHEEKTMAPAIEPEAESERAGAFTFTTGSTPDFEKGCTVAASAAHEIA